MAGGVAQVVEYLLRKHETLSLNPKAAKFKFPSSATQDIFLTFPTPLHPHQFSKPFISTRFFPKGQSYPPLGESSPLKSLLP
jgi:hypothetical protein